MLETALLYDRFPSLTRWKKLVCRCVATACSAGPFSVATGITARIAVRATRTVTTSRRMAIRIGRLASFRYLEKVFGCLTQGLDTQAFLHRLQENTKQGRRWISNQTGESLCAHLSMRRIGNLWRQIVDSENLRLAIKKAAKGKKNRPMVKYALDHQDEVIKMLQVILEKGFKNAEYSTKIIHEPKTRTIYILPFFPDRIIHHAIVNVLEPYWNKLFIADSYACRVGKGQHAGSRRCMGFVKKYKYCLKCDISKFYPSINHSVLKQILRQKLKDQRVLSLLYEIIDSVEGDINVPIGNLLSQWFGNLYLNELDKFVKHELHCKAYMRYSDDFVFFANTKEELHDYLNSIAAVLDRLHLKLSKSNIFPVKNGVDYLGYRHFPNCLLVRKSTVKRIKKRFAKIPELLQKGKITIERARGQIASANGWLKHANAFNLKKSLKLEELTQLVTA